MKKREKIILIVIACILVVSTGILGAFFLTREHIATAENDYKGIYNAYSAYESDSFMDIDGELNEKEWKDKEWYHNTGYAIEEGTFPSYETTAFLTEKGVYVAFTVKDPNLIYSGQKSMKKNSCFFIRVTAYRDGEAIGSRSDYGKESYIDMGCDVKGFTDFNRAVVVEGKLNSGDTKGATLEAFYAWETLNINPAEGIPTEVGIIPEYYGILSGEDAVTYISTAGVGMSYTSEASFLFDANGYCNADKDGAVVGDAKNGHTKTPGWDLSKVQEGIVESDADSGMEFLFFKDVFAKNLIMETTIIPTDDNLSFTNTTRAGFAFMTEGSAYGNACAVTKRDTDCSYETGVFTNIRLFTRIPSGNAINTIHYATAFKNTSSKQGVTLTVVKYGEDFIYFLDGKYMGTEKMASCAAEIYPALFTSGAGAIFKDYSCEELTEESMLAYLNKHGVYRVTAQLASGGGAVEASANYVQKGDSVDVSVKTNKGYDVASVLINEKEQLSSLKKKAVEGTFTLDNISKNQDVKVKFAKTSGKLHQLTVTATADKGYSAQLIVSSKTNGLLSYKDTLRSGNETILELPAGIYTLQMITDEYQVYTTQVNMNQDRRVSTKLTATAFPKKLTVNEKEVISQRDVFDVTKENEKKVSTSFEAGAKLLPLYFNQTAKNFVVTTTVSYTTQFKAGVDYQPDLMGGFYINDGSANAWVTAWKNGIRYRGHQSSSSKIIGLTNVNYLVYPEPVPVEFTMAKLGDKVYFYFNGIYGGEMAYTELGPNLDPNKEVAIGLTMLADKTADIEFSNYSLQTGDAAAKKYIEAHKPGSAASKALSANSLFAEYNALGTSIYNSALDRFNVSSDKVTGSYAMRTPRETMWFYSKEGSTTALVSATIKNTTDFSKYTEYQKDLFGGFSVASETSLGWIMANQKGTHITGSERERTLVDESVLFYDGTTAPKDVTLTLAMQDRYIYVYFDGVLVTRYTKARIVEGADANTKLIFGLRMNADKAADIEYSNFTYTEDAKKVSEYISSHQ